jgi:hypothetical protein
MDSNPDTSRIKALEAELEACLRDREFLDALDVCEEIEATGQVEIRHLLTMADCLLELRRKADARQAWLRVLERDAGNDRALQGLNRHFPGWRLAPPRPTPSADSPSLRVRMGGGAAAASSPDAPAGAPPARATKPAPAKPAPSSANTAESPRLVSKSSGASAPGSPSANAGAAGTAPATGRAAGPGAAGPGAAGPGAGAPASAPAVFGEVNWDYVMEDFRESRATAAS